MHYCDVRDAICFTGDLAESLEGLPDVHPLGRGSSGVRAIPNFILG